MSTSKEQNPHHNGEMEQGRMSDEMPNGVPKKAIKNMEDPNDKLNMIIEYVSATNSKVDNINEKVENIEANRNEDEEKKSEGCQHRYEICDSRFRKIEKIVYGVGGVVMLGSIVAPVVVAWIG